MSLFIVDVEADGPCPGLYSMVSFAAIKVQPDLTRTATFKGYTAPISQQWIPDALAVSGHSREEHLTFPASKEAMVAFAAFLARNSNGHPVFLSDNPAFDWQFINYYFILNGIKNPFGFSARRIGDIYSGLERNLSRGNNWKRLRKTKHSHDPLDDVRGNAEAFNALCQQHSIRY